MKFKKFINVMLCGAMLAGFTACEKDQAPVFNDQGIDQTDPNNDSDSENNKGLNGHKAVDLGLPSGLLWATCNVGAASPELSGYSFAWGETSPKADYDWDTYKWCNGDYDELTKYCYKSSYGYGGFTDSKYTLDLEDDAAHVNWGGAWRMPTKKEFEELLAYCSWQWITQNEANGYKVTGQNGNSIFLPAAGCGYGSSLEYYSVHGYYWSSSLDMGSPCRAYRLYFYSSYCGWDYYNSSYKDSYRSYGLSVRAVCRK